MSHLFGPITQNGYVVADIDQVLPHWVDAMGIGPWYVFDEIATNDSYYRGEPTTVRLKIALAFSGDLQIELVEQLDDTACIYRDFLLATGGRGGLQHVSSWPSTDEFDRIVDRCRTSGADLLWHGELSGTRFGYVDTGAGDGTVFEFTDLSDASKAFFAQHRREAADWDGSDPIRRLT